MGKRKKHTPKFKFTAVLESIQKDSVAEVARKYGINANQLSTWRKRFFDDGYAVFESTKDQEKQRLEKKLAKMEQLLGKKEVELSLLKNYLDFYAPPDGE
jgi:transposase-like protein